MIGTPKNLHQAIVNGLEPLIPTQQNEQHRERLANRVSEHVQDLLAQKFGAAMCSYDDETAQRMAVLFKRILEG